MKVVALVITYNRQAMLERCIDRLLTQKLPLHGIVVFNNASTDGSKNYLDSLQNPLLKIWHNDKNVGGAGGYHDGILLAMDLQADWIWCVEDDILVPRDFNAKAQPFLASAKQDGRGFVFPNLLCVYEPRSIQRPQPKEIGKDNSLEKAVFAGCLLNATAIASCGLPIKKYFIYFDDWEYTSRLSRNGFVGLYVPELWVWHHDASKPMDKVYLNTPYPQLWKSLYGIRNELSFYKQYHPKQYPKLLIKHLFYIPLQILLYRQDHKFISAWKWSMWSLKSLWF